ncbi:MAG TPA: hypothetical protein VGM87_13960 [Roseomonas sp.]|jgi:hypothetical protein
MPPENAATIDTPQGTDVATAASNIADILTREGGHPEKQARPKPEAEAVDAEAQQESNAEGETQIDVEEPDEGAEAEVEPEEADPAETEEDSTEPDPEKTLVTVQIGDKTERLPLAEVTKGYLRQADYTRKTQELAKERETFTGDANAVRQERLQYAQLLPALAYQIQQSQGPEPDWQRLKDEDPIGYVLKREEWRDRQQRVDAARQEYERVRVSEAEVASQAGAAHLQQEGEKLLEAMPAWKDKDRRNADRTRVRDYGRKLGWSEDELSSVTDHRAVVVLYKAMKYDEAVARRLSPQPPAPRGPSPQPSAARTPPSRQVTDLTRSKQRLAKTHSLRDAKAVIEGLL